MRMGWSERLGWGRVGYVGALCALSGVSVGAGASAQAQSLFDSGASTYTDAQAERGRAAYADNCASCHGMHLDDGQFAPPVKGSMFQAQWHTQSAAALLSYMATKMPPLGAGQPARADLCGYRRLRAAAERRARRRKRAVGLPRGQRPGGPGAPRRGPAPAAGMPSAAWITMTRSIRRPWRSVPPCSTSSPRSALRRCRTPAPADWLMWRGNFGTTGYSQLDQINTHNAADLQVAWTLALPVSGNEITPLVHDGVMFIESANTVEALNAADGSILWQYVRALPPRGSTTAAPRTSRAWLCSRTSCTCPPPTVISWRWM